MLARVVTIAERGGAVRVTGVNVAVQDYPTADDALALYQRAEALAAEALGDRVSFDQADRSALRATMLFAAAGAASQLALFRPVMELRKGGRAT
jgi:hypothetical protein